MFIKGTFFNFVCLQVCWPIKFYNILEYISNVSEENNTSTPDSCAKLATNEQYMSKESSITDTPNCQNWICIIILLLIWSLNVHYKNISSWYFRNEMPSPLAVSDPRVRRINYVPTDELSMSPAVTPKQANISIENCFDAYFSFPYHFSARSNSIPM